MKNLIFILFLFCSATVFGTTYYVAATGGNNGNDGSSVSPWATLAYAVTQATAGDTIYMKAGSHTIAATVSVPVKVHITGAGATSIINYTNTTANEPCLALVSVGEGTDGSQSISYIKMNGGDTASYAVDIRNRDSVLIYNCTFEDFFVRGVVCHGKGYSDGKPTTYLTGFKFYNNTVHDCSDYFGTGASGDGRGGLGIGASDGALIYSNTFTQDDRGADANGYLIKFAGTGYNKNLKIYRNTITKTPYDGSSYNFAIELWNNYGGLEIYDNTIQGSIDLAGYGTSDSADVSYAVKIYRNTFAQPTVNSEEESAIVIESNHSGGFYFYQNLMQNLSVPITMYPTAGRLLEDIYIYYNVFDEVGYVDKAGGNGIYLQSTISGTDTTTIRNLYYYNNTFYQGDSRAYTAMPLTFEGKLENVNIKNNIVIGFSYCIYLGQADAKPTIVDGLNISNNDFYDNGNSNNPKFVAGEYVLTDSVSADNIKLDPLFITGTYRLKSNSPCINVGLDVGLTTDYRGYGIKGLPDIGAYEFLPISVKSKGKYIRDSNKRVIQY